MAGGGTFYSDSTGLSVQIALAGSFDAVSDFTVDGSTATCANGAWQYGYLPNLSSPATSFGLYSITTLTWQGAAGLTGYISPGTAEAPLLLCNQSSPPATIVVGTASVPVGFLEMHPGTSGEYSALQFLTPASGGCDIFGQFQGQDTAGTTTDVHILQVSGGTATSLFSGTIDGFYGSGGSGIAPFSLAGVALAVGDALLFVVGADGSYYNDSTGLSVQLVSAGSTSGTQVSTYTYDGDGLKRVELLPDGSVTTLVWDGSDYLQGRS